MKDKSFFAIFGLDEAFDIDIKALEEKYFALQRQAHPDMQTGNELDSALLNNAYKTLKNRFKRAEYLIDLQGKSNQPASQELLMEMMDLRDDVDAEKIAKVQAEVDDLFNQFAKTHSADIFIRIKYLQRFLEENKV